MSPSSSAGTADDHHARDRERHPQPREHREDRLVGEAAREDGTALRVVLHEHPHGLEPQHAGDELADPLLQRPSSQPRCEARLTNGLECAATEGGTRRAQEKGVRMELHGVGVGRGIAVGPILRMPDPLPVPEPGSHGGDAAAEFATVQASLATVGAELTAKGQAAGGEAQAVLEAASMMAQDPMLVDDVKARIDAGTTGERAVHEAFASFQEQLVAMGGYMAERATDLGDVSQRIIANLRGVPAPGVPSSDTPFILVAPDLAPADTALLAARQGARPHHARRRADEPHRDPRPLEVDPGDRRGHGRARAHGRHGRRARRRLRHRRGRPGCCGDRRGRGDHRGAGGRGIRADHRRRPQGRHEGAAARQPRFAEGCRGRRRARRRGRRTLPHRVPVPRLVHRPDRRGSGRSSTPSSCSTSPAGRSSCAPWTPAPTSR